MKDSVIIKNADDFTSSVVVPHMFVSNNIGKNVIWCSTINICWKEMNDEIKYQLKNNNDSNELFENMNKSNISKNDLFDDSYISLSGKLENGIIDNIKESLDTKFHGAAFPELLSDKSTEGWISYCYMFKYIEFKKRFVILDDILIFKGNKVKCFGTNDYFSTAEHVKIYKYPWPGYWDINEEIIIEIESNNNDDQFILARIMPRETLIETVLYVQNIVNMNNPITFNKGKIIIPMLNFSIIKNYQELSIDNGSTIQLIRFILNEKGIYIKSESYIDGSTGDDIIFDKPFLLIMKKRKSINPYFVMWIDNAELMVPCEAAK